MKKLLAATLLAGLAITGATSADARDGCGPRGHRDGYGHCRPNRGPGMVVVAPGLVVGQRYDRGYWDGRRYWQHRERHRDGWRYR